MRQNLCEIYLRNIDPVFKILHRPSLVAFLCDDQPYLNFDKSHQAPATLACSVYYAAACTIGDLQCQEIFGADKKTVISGLQLETESMLAEVDFAASTELTVLQAYVLSLVSYRFCFSYNQ